MERYDMYDGYMAVKPFMSNISHEDAMKIVLQEARDSNYGLYRHWEIDGTEYYDCGPIVYRLKSHKSID